MSNTKTITGDVTQPDCPPGHIRSDKDLSCVPEVRFHREPNISLTDAQTLCRANGWVMATAPELQAAWDKLGYNNFGYGMIDNGVGRYKIALPIQQDLTSSLKRGANIGVGTAIDGFYYVRAEAVTREQNIVIFAEATIVGDTPQDCPPGHFRNAAGECIPDVQFFRWFDPAGLNLEAAKIICKENGWVLATAEDVQAAWANTDEGLDLLVYGMIADGSFAVPIQRDNDLFQRGLNIGVKGGNEGFFYLPVNNPLPPVDPPLLTPEEHLERWLASFPAKDRERALHWIQNSQDYAQPLAESAMSHCSQPFGSIPGDNWMLNKWKRPITVSSKDLLAQAAKAYLEKKQFPVNDSALLQLSASVRTDPEARFKFAPFLLKECFGALVAEQPTLEQAEYKSVFESYQSCVDYHRAKATFQSWEEYQGRSDLIPQKYSPATFSILFNKPPEVAGFMESDPLEFGLEGGRAVSLLYLPLAANAGLLDDHPIGGDIATMGDDLMGVVVGAGLGSAVGISSGLVGSTYAFMKHAATELTKNIIAANQGILDSAKISLHSAKLELAGASDSVAKLAARGNIAGFEAEIGKITRKMDSALKQVGKIAPKISRLLGPAIIAITAAVTIGMEIAEAVKRGAYEKKLRDNANRVHNFNVVKFLDVPAKERENRRMALFTLMVKHLIAEPANNRQLSLALPLIPPAPTPTAMEALSAAVRSNDIKDVKFHNQNSLTLAQAQELAKEKGWSLATEAEVQEAWTHHQLNVFAYGMMADGGFAVPLQSDQDNFKKGPNIGATGGNQGFFYTTHKEVKFHAQNSMTLAEAWRFALQRAWVLATPSEVQNAWTYHQLNVYAYGLTADGSFAVPVQSDQDNFKKGPNIGATGGNQGFFYTEATPSAASQAALDAMRAKEVAAAQALAAAQEMVANRLAVANARAEEYAFIQIEDELHRKALLVGDNANGHIRHQEAADRTNASWQFIPTGDGYYYIVDGKDYRAIVAGDTADNGVYHQAPRDRDNAKWKVEPLGNGTFHITDKKHGRSLVAGTTYDGNVYHQHPQGRKNAAWRLKVVGSENGKIPDEINYAHLQIEDGLHGKVLLSEDTYSGNIRHQDANEGDNAKWQFIPAGDGFYYIIDVKHQKALVAGDTANNRIYHQAAYERENAQWKLEPLGNGTFHITDKKHGKSLVAGTTYDGNVYHQPPQGRENAAWKLKVVGSNTGVVPKEME